MAFEKQDSIKLPQEKKQQNMLVVLALIILVIAIVAYFGFFRSSGSVPAPIDQPGPGPVLSSPASIIEEISFDYGFFKNPQFQELKIYGEWPLTIEVKARANPFIPF